MKEVLRIRHASAHGKDIETGEIAKDFMIPKSYMRFFDDFSDVKAKAKGKGWGSQNQQHKSCDLYMSSKKNILQMTVVEKHPVKISCLDNVLQSRIQLRKEIELGQQTLIS